MAVPNIESGRNAEHMGYVVSHLEYDGRHGPEINLGLANSPIGPAKELEEPLAKRSPLQELSRYPEDPLHMETRGLLVKGLGLKGYGPESVLFVDNGSYGAGDEVIRYLAQKGKNILYAPEYSFPNVTQWIDRHPNIEYVPVAGENLHPLSAQREILEIPSDELEDSIIYLDYPNNPFGVGSPHLVREVIDYTTKHGAVPFVDVAFAEVLGEEFRRVIQYTVDHGGVAIGSLSKTQGLPGLRTGYAILPAELSQNGYSGSQRMVFGLNREAEFVHTLLWKQENENEPLATKHARRVAEYNITTNNELATRLEELGLQLGHTDARTPIQVVRSEYSDFYQRLALNGIKTESLFDYKGTLANGTKGHAHSAVRMLTPQPGQMDEVIRRVEIALR